MNNKNRLTAKQEAFIVNYVTSHNATQAAIEAGYSPKTAAVSASENLNKPYVIARRKELEGMIASDKIMLEKERRERLSEIARARLTDYVTPEGIKIDRESPNTAAFSGIKTKIKYSKKGKEPEVITDIDLHNPIAAIAELNKMEHVYDEKPQYNDNRQYNFIIQSDQAKEKVNRLLAGEIPKQLTQPDPPQDSPRGDFRALSEGIGAN